MTSEAERIPAVPSLSTILPAGTEGGKEFARIVNLLLLADARRSGREISLLNDAAGDYEGLDAFTRDKKTKEVTGYQFKFFSSPLSDEHRSSIKKSVVNALNKSKRLKLTKYVIVTPDDLTNSATRRTKGDLAWLESLRSEMSEYITIEHMGHTEIIAHFLNTPYLCLFYYPQLVKDGVSRRRTIQEVRQQYDENIRRRFGRIEFVGMSVYKEEASRQIPLEDIYIPLSVVPEKVTGEGDDTPRAQPESFLAPASRTVILGDPGSGKSTLLSFLALRGISTGLQSRCGGGADQRLTITVTLRRYADDLKDNRNLSLLD